jgi:hypothetical protein
VWTDCSIIRVKAMEGTEDLEMQVLKNSPAYGARNVPTVAAGTGETLPGPVDLRKCVAGASESTTAAVLSCRAWESIPDASATADWNSSPAGPRTRRCGMRVIAFGN